MPKTCSVGLMVAEREPEVRVVPFSLLVTLGEKLRPPWGKSEK